MPGIYIKSTSHDLNVDPTFKPVKQKQRKLCPKQAKAVNDEVDKLLKIRLIREVQYPDRLANPVAVKKKNEKWRVCIDFTDRIVLLTPHVCHKIIFFNRILHLDRILLIFLVTFINFSCVSDSEFFYFLQGILHIIYHFLSLL